MNILPHFFCAALSLACGNAGASGPPSLADLAAKVSPSVVSIASTDPVSGTPSSNPDNDGGGDGSAYHPADAPGTVLPPPKAEEALGSGFVFDPAGYILTNNHVINGASSVTVTFQDGTILPATVVGRDKDADLAVLKVDAGRKLPALSFGKSEALRVGDWVMAIGNPFGLPSTTTAGIVSALDRNIGEDKYDDFIQTDAPINRGNSGGPMFNMDGEVVGVNSAIYSPSGGSIGIGFAIPSAMVAPVAAQLRDSGAMVRGWLGAATEEVTPEIEASLSLPDTSGALIGAVAPGSPAAKAGLQAGDVLVGLAGIPIKNPRALFIRAAEIPAGQSVRATFWRDGERQEVMLDMAVPPAAIDNTITPATPPAPANVTLASIGCSVSAAPADGGVAVTAVSVNGPSAKAGVVAGDLIEQLTGGAVTSAAALQSALASLAKTQAAAVFLISGDNAAGTDPGPRWVSVNFVRPAAAGR
jgi:serine protease Do/2-alkenal reductase